MSSESGEHAGYLSNPFDLVMPSARGLLRNWKPFIFLALIWVAALVVSAIAIVVLAVVHAYAALAFAVLVVVVGIIVLSAYTAPAFTRVQLAAAHGTLISLGKAFAGTKPVAWKLLGTQLLAGLAILGGLILLVIPGLIFAVWYSMVPYIVINEGVTGTAALRRSHDLVRGRFVDMLGLLSLGSIANILTIVPLLGTLVAIVISLLISAAPALRYLQLQKLKASEDHADIPTSPLNWLAMLLALVGFFISNAHNVQQAQAPTVEKHSQVY